MKKDESLEILENLKKIKKETEIIEAREKEKYKVGVILNETINALRVCISSLEQLEARGEKVNSVRQNNMKNLRIILLNILDLTIILLPQSRSGADVLKTQLLAKISPKKRDKKKAV